MQDRRRMVRNRVYYGGVLAFNARRSTFACVVRNFSAGGAPIETGQFFATSVAHPSTAVSVGGIALSPATSDHRRYLYAIDGSDGSIMVFDATSPRRETWWGDHAPRATMIAWGGSASEERETPPAGASGSSVPC